MKHVYQTKFLRSLKKLDKSLQVKSIHAINEFKNEDNHRVLRLHKLTGKMKNMYSFSVDFSHRIVIKYIDNEIHFLDIGDHDIYK